MQRRLCAAILSLEAVAFGLSTPVLISIAGLSTATAVWIGVGLSVACIVAAGLLRFAWGYWLGWAIQVAAIAVGIEARSMFVVGTVFLVLWATAWFLGRKIETERAEWTARGEFPGQAAAGSGERSH